MIPVTQEKLRLLEKRARERERVEACPLQLQAITLAKGHSYSNMVGTIGI